MLKTRVNIKHLRNLTRYYEFVIGRRTLATSHGSTSCCGGLLNPSIELKASLTRLHSRFSTMEGSAAIFQGVIDRFNGITIDSNKQTDFNTNFGEKLEKCLEQWRKEKRRGIWFKIHTENVACLPDLTKHGFNFHHAKQDYVMVYKWLPENEEDNVPNYSHTLVGVGAIVVNDKNEVLVVSDRFAMIPNSWKLPGGYVEAREYLPDAAVREVREETGVVAEFQSLISVRQSHGGGFGCSDIYVVLALKPLTTELIKCEREIAKVCWMPIDEYLEHPNVHETNRKFIKKYLHFKENGIKMSCEKTIHQVLKREYIVFNIEDAKW